MDPGKREWRVGSGGDHPEQGVITYNDIVFSAVMDHLQMAECALQNWNCQPPV